MKKMRKLIGGIKAKLLHKNDLEYADLAGLRLLTHKGTIRKLADQDDAWLFHLMGEYDLIFDIGANIGLSSLFAKVQNPEKQILLVDPNPEALSIAAKNLITNNLSVNTEFISAFVSNKIDTEIDFYTIGSGAAGSMYKGHAESAAAIGESFKVKTLTIDHLVEAVNWLPKFVKIDVEGVEALVLQGAVKTASQMKTVFMVEMHSPSELPMRENAALVIEWASQVGYQAWYMRDAVALSESAQIADRGKCHLLLMPKGQVYPDALAQIPQRAPIPNIL